MVHKIFIALEVDAVDRDTALSAVKYWEECIRDDMYLNRRGDLPEGTIEFQVLANDELDHSVYFRSDKRDDG